MRYCAYAYHVTDYTKRIKKRVIIFLVLSPEAYDHFREISITPIQIYAIRPTPQWNDRMARLFGVSDRPGSRTQYTATLIITAHALKFVLNTVNTMCSEMELSRGFHCQSSFGHARCRVVLRANYLAILLAGLGFICTKNYICNYIW